MAGPIRVGVMGCGTIAHVHFDGLDKLGPEKAQVVALYNRGEERLRKAAQRYPKARSTHDPKEMVAPGDLDLVFVCTMPDTHKRMSVLALEAGAHVLCEKPFAMTHAEAKEIVETAERAGRMVQIGTNMRYMPNVVYVRDLVASGKLGKPVYLHPWTTHVNPPVWGPHYIKAISGGGALASTLVHTLDCSLFVAGHPDPISVSAQVTKLYPGKRGPTTPKHVQESWDVEDLVVAHVRFEDNIMMLAYSNWCLDAARDSHAFEVVCEKGTLCQVPFEVWEDVDGKLVDRTPPDKKGMGMDEWHTSIHTQNADLVNRLLEGKPFAMDVREPLNVQRIADAIYESAATGREVRLK